MTNEEFLQCAWRTRVNPLLWGPPGVGKTSTIRGVARRLGWYTLELVASVRDPADFGGYPRMTHEEFVSLRPSEIWRPLVEEERDCVLFLDEITCSPPAVQEALLRVVLDRVVGDVRLSSRCRVVAAANPPEYTASRYELSDALASRFHHREFVLNPERWIENFPTYWGETPDLSELGLSMESWARARSMVSAYIRTRPDQLFVLPQHESERKRRGWPNPRSWDFASQMLAAVDCRLDDAADLMAGNIGEPAALEFVAWAETASLPDPASILENPSSFRPDPVRLDIVYAVLQSVVSLAAFRGDENSWHSAWKVLYHAGKKGAVDIAAAVARPLARARKSTSWRVPSEVTAFARVVGEVCK